MRIIFFFFFQQKSFFVRSQHTIYILHSWHVMRWSWLEKWFIQGQNKRTGLVVANDSSKSILCRLHFPIIPHFTTWYYCYMFSSFSYYTIDIFDTFTNVMMMALIFFICTHKDYYYISFDVHSSQHLPHHYQ